MSQSSATRRDNSIDENIRYEMKMPKDILIEKLREKGCRITHQRMLLLDIILEQECTCCKEIYYKASKIDKNIGSATVYRFINTLEDIGAIDSKNTYRIIYDSKDEVRDSSACVIELDDNTVCKLSEKNWNLVVKTGMKMCGYITSQNIMHIKVNDVSFCET